MLEVFFTAIGCLRFVCGKLHHYWWIMLVLAYDKLPDHTHVTKFDNKSSLFRTRQASAASCHPFSATRRSHTNHHVGIGSTATFDTRGSPRPLTRLLADHRREQQQDAIGMHRPFVLLSRKCIAFSLSDRISVSVSVHNSLMLLAGLGLHML